ncbi:MAG: transposase, partial [Deltaproteobacteria bacterium]|nr:transposase [Deltaproteobacteria bacterium]
MLPIPDFLPIVILAFWPRLLTWLSAQVYERLRAPDDFWVRLADHLDCAPLERACAAYQHVAGPGAQATHTVPRLVRALLVKSLWNLSLRELEYTLRTNLVIRWFVGYGLFERTPDHSTLERFEQWVIKQHGRTFFDETLRQIDADFPEERRRPQVGDTFAMQAHAAKEGLVRLIRHTCQCLLRNLTAAAPPAAAAVTAQLDARALFGAADERDEFYLDAEARRVRLQTTVVAALACADLVQRQLAAAALPAAQTQPVTARLADLTKIVADEVAITRDPAGVITHVATLPAKQQGSYRLGSATDPDATYRVHGPDKCDLGYNVNVAVNTHFVREIQAATGAQPDAAGLPDLLTAQQEHHGVTPPQFIYDAAAGEAKTR